MEHNDETFQEGIDPETIATLAEKGFNDTVLSDYEKRHLASQGLQEIYDIWEFEGEKIEPLQPVEMNGILDKYYPKINLSEGPSLVVSFVKSFYSIISLNDEWQINSPIFSYRHTAEDSESTCVKKLHKGSIHLEFLPVNNSTTINIMLDRKSFFSSPSYEIEMYQNGACIESVLSKELFSFSDLEFGTYTFKVIEDENVIDTFTVTVSNEEQ